MTLGPFVGSGGERVYEVHDWAEVYRLFYRGGLSKARVAERLGMSRNTVACLLGLDEPSQLSAEASGVEAGSV